MSGLTDLTASGLGGLAVFLVRFQLRQVERTVDQVNVRKRLRKVADEAARARVIFLA